MTTTTRTARRYYAFVPEVGRLRIPDCLNEAEAIVWAAGRGATNVVREDGPASKPTEQAFVWKADETSKAFDLHAALWATLTAHLPKMTVRETSLLVRDLEKAVKDNT